MTECIISLTSHTKSRMELLPKYLYESILKHNTDKFKIVLTLFKDDMKDISEKLQKLIDSHLVELLVVDENLRSHLKYFYVMQKYRDLPIITIDDDTIYPYEAFEYMLEEHKKNPNCVLCRSCQEITFTNHKVNVQQKWSWSPCQNISKRNHAEGYASILYPANCLKITDELIPEVKKCILSDDIFLTILEIRNGIDIFYLPQFRHSLVLSTKGENAISLTPNIVDINNKYIKEFENDFNKVG